MSRRPSLKRIAPKGSSETFLRAHVSYQGDDCLIWPYRLCRGYGLATICGKQRRANNWMCRLAHGEPFSIWRHAAHKCGNPACVNPNHLRWATHAENMADKEGHGTVNRGERNGKTTITAEDVLAIRMAPAKLEPLVKKYGLAKHTISKIRSGRTWKHVGGPRTSRQRGFFPTCWNGHPYDEANTRWTSDGYRQCRACDAENARARRRRKSEPVAERRAA